MFENAAGLIEMAFVYSVALGFGIWQIISVRRQIRRDREAAEKARGTAKSESSDAEL